MTVLSIVLRNVFHVGPQIFKVLTEPLELGSSSFGNESRANLGVETDATYLHQVCLFSSCGSQWDHSHYYFNRILNYSVCACITLYSHFLLTISSKPEARFCSSQWGEKFWSGKKKCVCVCVYNYGYFLVSFILPIYTLLYT